jgi:hypothetical protein
MSLDKTTIIGEIHGVIIGVAKCGHKITVKLKDEFLLDIPKNVFKLPEYDLEKSGKKIIYQIKESPTKVKYQEIVEDLELENKTNRNVVKEFFDTK